MAGGGRKAASNIHKVVAAHFADVIYNGMFLRAVQIQDSQEDTPLEDAYRTMLAKYNRGLRDDKWCQVTLDNIHKIHNSFQPYKDKVAFSDALLRQFVPPDVADSMNEIVAEKKIYDIIRRISELSINFAISEPMFTQILDDHDNMTNVSELKAEIADYCIIVRESIHADYARERAGVSSNVTIDASALTAASKQIKALEANRNAMAAEIERYAHALSVAIAQRDEISAQLAAQMEKSGQLLKLVGIMRGQQAPVAVSAVAATSRTPIVRTPIVTATPSRVVIEASNGTPRSVYGSSIREGLLNMRSPSVRATPPRAAAASVQTSPNVNITPVRSGRTPIVQQLRTHVPPTRTEPAESPVRAQATPHVETSTRSEPSARSEPPARTETPARTEPSARTEPPSMVDIGLIEQAIDRIMDDTEDAEPVVSTVPVAESTGGGAADDWYSTDF